MFVKQTSRWIALFAFTLALTAGAGLVVSQARGPAGLGDQPAPGAGAAPKGATAEFIASEIATIYRTNEALVDQKFRDKRLMVTGTLVRIRRGATDEKNRVLYEVLLGTGRGGDEAGPSVTNARPAAPETFLAFEFTDVFRDELAKLTQGQLITIEGCARAYEEKVGRTIVYFSDSKVVKVGR